MDTKKKNILIVSSILLGVGALAFFLYKMFSKKSTPPKSIKTANKKPANNKNTQPAKLPSVTASSVDDSLIPDGNLVESNWDGRGGYLYQFSDGNKDYYSVDNVYLFTRDASGNMISSAEYNNWNDSNGYRIVFIDGTADYYKGDSTFDHSGASGYDLTTAPFGLDSGWAIS